VISVEYVRTMAAYNGWQNESLYHAANGLSDAARRRDRGAFFGSIHATLNHLLWADTIWMSRFAGWSKPRAESIQDSVNEREKWDDLMAARVGVDQRIVAWAGQLTPADTEGHLTWYSGAVDREITKPRWLLYTHFFNHQTHHRGQVHALVTAEGIRLDDTDLPLMPMEAQEGRR